MTPAPGGRAGPKPARGDKTGPVFGTLESGVRTLSHLVLVEKEELQRRAFKGGNAQQRGQGMGCAVRECTVGSLPPISI